MFLGCLYHDSAIVLTFGSVGSAVIENNTGSTADIWRVENIIFWVVDNVIFGVGANMILGGRN